MRKLRFQSAPLANGVEEDLVEKENKILEIKAELEEIRNNFEPDINMVQPTTHYIVSEYNKAHVGEEINGDTAEYIMSYMTAEEVENMETIEEE